MLPIKNTTFLISDSVIAYLGWPSAVKQSTKAYWKDMGIAPIMNMRMPHTAFSATAGFSGMNSPANGCAQNIEITVIAVVNTRHEMSMRTSARFISFSFFAP